MKVKDNYNLEEIFGDLNHKVIWSDHPVIRKNDTITITNSNCEFEYDSKKGCFEQDLMYAFIVDLELLNADLSNYEPAKSNNGGCYAFAECRVKKILERGY